MTGPVSRFALLPFALAGLLLAGCTDREPQRAESQTTAPSPPSSDQRVDRQTAFRVRERFDAQLNSDTGWAAAVNQPATVLADQPFRIRFEVEAGDAPGPRRYGLQFRHNDGPWKTLPAEEFPYPQKSISLPLNRGLQRGAWDIVRGSSDALRTTSDAEEDVLRVRAADQGFMAFGRYDIHWIPEEFAVELRLPDRADAQAGLVIGRDETGVTTRVELTAPDRVRVMTGSNDDSTVLAEGRGDRIAGDWIELKILFEDDRLIVEVDDTVVIETSNQEVVDRRLGLDLLPNRSVDLRSIAIEAEASTPPTSIVRAATFAHAAAVEDLLPISARPLTGGAGISNAPSSPAWIPDGGHSEWSFPIVIRRFSDFAALNESGDRFEYRLVDADERPLEADAVAAVTLAVADGHLGGTFVETPMRLGPWQADHQDLYFIIEPAETWNRPMVVRSTDGGRSWREADGGNRPDTGDLEGLGSDFVDGRIHILHQVSEAVVYHAFDTHEPPGRWVVRDERVTEMPQPPTQVADLAARSDGSLVAVYGAGNALHVRVRSRDGDWGTANPIEPPSGVVFSGPTLVADGNDTVHLTYTASDDIGWLRRIGPDGSMSEPRQFADDLGTGEEDVGAILPLLLLSGTNGSETVAVVYRTAAGHLHERRVGSDGLWTDAVRISDRPVVQNAVDSDQAGADAVAFGDTIHVLFIDAESGHLFHTSGREGEWSVPEPVFTERPVQWVRGSVVRSDRGEPVYGFIYDAGSNGGSGMNRYGEIALDSE